MKRKINLVAVFLFFGIKTFATTIPNTITTLGPPVVALDTNFVCAGSVIDVSFFSTGAFMLNTYKLQLSDAAGNSLHPDSVGACIIGSLQSDVAYDPANPTPGYPPPGTIEGLIPDTVSPGCNYLLRVVANSPVTGPAPLIGASWGPFCIQHCDIITNNEQDINFCLYPNTSMCVSLNINTHFYNSNAAYLPGNQFMVQLISRGPIPPPFTQVGTLGALGTFSSSTDTTVQFCISTTLLASSGISPGEYYMRIVATNSSLGADSSFGTMIRVNIGSPSATPFTIQAFDWNTFQPVDTVCSGDLVYFILTPNPNSNSTYYWYSADLQGSPIVQNTLLVNFAGFSGNFSVYVRENNFGCFGPPTATITIYVSTVPNVSISPPATVCVGDTVQYTTTFANGTSWSWWLSGSASGTIINTTNNSVQVLFNSAGVDTLFCQALNACGSDTGFRKITVNAAPLVPSLTQNGDTLTCSVAGGVTYRWYRNGILQAQYTTQSIIITPAENGNWSVVVSNTAPPFCSSTSLQVQTTVGIYEMLNFDTGLIFPNPATAELSVAGFSFSGKAEINIYNTLGERILSREIAMGEKEIKLNVKNLAAGIYVVKVFVGEKVFVKKVVKE